MMNLVIRLSTCVCFILFLSSVNTLGAQVIEAENADVLTGVETAADAGASGGFRVRNFDEVGDSILFNSVPAGTRIEIQFSLSRDNFKQCSLYVNGVDVKTLTFYPTSGWTNYLARQYYLTVGGSLELRIDADDFIANREDSCASIDKIEIFQDTVTTDKSFVDSRGRVVGDAFTDSYGDHYIGDYTNCGYGRGGRDELPDPSVIPVMATVSSPGVGMDAGPTIQAAIDSVSLMPLNDQGFRGAVLLQAGTYEIPGTLSISASGVVLRGTGDGDDPSSDTILVGTGVDVSQRTLITIAGDGFFGEVGGTSEDIIDDYVPSFSRSFNVADASGFSVGDTVIVLRESPQPWIDEIGMDLLDNPWMPGDRDLRFDRLITKIDGNRITVDAPLPNSYDRDLDGGRIYRYSYSSTGRIFNTGIEYLRIVSEFTSATDEDHMWNCIVFDDIEHGWARNVTGEAFGFGMTRLLTGAKWISIVDCAGIDMVSQVTGGRRYPFVNERGQLTLVRRCFARSGRHDFVFQSTVPGPNAFVDCATQNSLNDTGPHQRWTAGALYDNVFVYGHDINIRDRGNSGSGHGWTGANQTVWNSLADDTIIERPPTAQNWSIGTTANTQTGNGYYESNGAQVSPTSLYDAQLDYRLQLPMPGALVYEEPTSPMVPELGAVTDAVIAMKVPVSVGAIDSSGSRGYVVTLSDVGDNNHLSLRLDANTSNDVFTAEVKGPGGTESVSVPFNIEEAGFAVDYTMHAIFEIGATTTDVYYKLIRNDIEAVVWESSATLATATSATIDQLSKTVEASAVGSIGNVEISLGEIFRFTPIADAFVSQATPASNDGTSTGLQLRASSTNQVDAYLKFDVGGVTGNIDVARLRLHSDSLNGSVKAYAVADTSWSEGAIVWNNKPVVGSLLDNYRTILPGQDVLLNVAAQVSSNGMVSVALRNDTDVSTTLLTLASRESGVTADRPVLEVIGEGTPVPIDLSGFVLE
jgi:hypothetical protein